MTTVNISILKLGTLAVSSKGQKTVPLMYENGSSVNWVPSTAMQVAFEPRAFGQENASRVNLVLHPTSEMISQLQELDAVVVSLLAKSSLEIFGKKLTETEVQSHFTSSLKTSTKGFLPTMKVKMNVSGKNITRCWDENKQICAQPDRWVSCKAMPKITIRSVWMMGKDMGLLFETLAVQLEQTNSECPF